MNLLCAQLIVFATAAQTQVPAQLGEFADCSFRVLESGKLWQRRYRNPSKSCVRFV